MRFMELRTEVPDYHVEMESHDEECVSWGNKLWICLLSFIG